MRHRVVPDTMRKAALYGRLLLERRLQRADALVTISEGTSRKLLEFLGRSAVVVPPAVTPDFTRKPETEVIRVLERHGIRQPYLLTIASADPHKNIELLIRVFLAMKREKLLGTYTLVLGGKNTDRLIQDLCNSNRLETQGILGLGYVPDEDLPALYSGADIFVLPSLDEGFGMPVLEARACQTKIVATDARELREAGGDRAIYIRPDAEGIRAGILAALTAERPSAPDNLWTWKSSAEILADVFNPISAASTTAALQSRLFQKGGQ
jgi:glycosyltransferase involved in cell wall biosynthesis